MMIVRSIIWSSGQGGYLFEFVFINLVVCFWVKKNYLLFMILNNFKFGGDGKLI